MNEIDVSGLAEVLPFKPRHTITIEHRHLAPVIPIDSVVFAQDVIPQNEAEARLLENILAEDPQTPEAS